MKTLIASLGIALVLLVTAAAQAQENLEAVRQDVLRYVQALQKLPPAVVAQWGGEVDLVAAEMSVRNLTPEELRTLAVAMERMPYWRDVAGALETARVVPDAGGGALPVSSDLVADLTRKQLLAMMDIFSEVPAGLVPPGYHERVARVKAAINALPPDQVMELNEHVKAAAPTWSARLEARVPGEGAVQALASCSGKSGLDWIKCEVGNIVSNVGAIGTNVATWATNTVTAIKDGLLDFLGDFAADVLPSQEDFVAFMGDVQGILARVPDAIRIPCMEDGSTFVFFGEVGTLAAAHKWERAVAFPANVVEEGLPDDVWSGNLKAVGAVLNFVPQHILGCFQDAYAARFDELQADHRTWVTDNLDVVADTRATQVRVDDAQGATNDVIDDVGKLETKLDALGDEVAAIDVIQLRKRAFLGDTRDEALRLHIEVDLLRQSIARIALFQLPAKAGGHLELAREIVGQTLARRKAAGVNVTKALGDYKAGVKAYNIGQYKDAYGWFRKAYQRAVM